MERDLRTFEFGGSKYVRIQYKKATRSLKRKTDQVEG